MQRMLLHWPQAGCNLAAENAASSEVDLRCVEGKTGPAGARPRLDGWAEASLSYTCSLQRPLLPPRLWRLELCGTSLAPVSGGWSTLARVIDLANGSVAAIPARAGELADPIPAA